MGERRYRDRQWVKGETGKTGMVWRQERQKGERDTHRHRERHRQTDRQRGTTGRVRRQEKQTVDEERQTCQDVERDRKD